MACPKCGKSNAASARFCSGCGGALAVADLPAGERCASCGHQNKPLARFCAGCGNSLSAAASPSEVPASPPVQAEPAPAPPAVEPAPRQAASAGGVNRKSFPVAALIAVLAVSVAAIGAAAWWLKGTPEPTVVAKQADPPAAAKPEASPEPPKAAAPETVQQGAAPATPQPVPEPKSDAPKPAAEAPEQKQAEAPAPKAKAAARPAPKPPATKPPPVAAAPPPVANPEPPPQQALAPQPLPVDPCGTLSGLQRDQCAACRGRSGFQRVVCEERARARYCSSNPGDRACAQAADQSGKPQPSSTY